MKKVLLGLALCLFAICNTGCSAIDSVLDDYLNYCTVTIEYDYEWDYEADYRDLKVVFDEKEYNAVGSYKVLKGSVIDLSWSYGDWYTSRQELVWKTSSESVSVGTNGRAIIVIAGPDVTVSIDEAI